MGHSFVLVLFVTGILWSWLFVVERTLQMSYVFTSLPPVLSLATFGVSFASQRVTDERRPANSYHLEEIGNGSVATNN